MGQEAEIVDDRCPDRLEVLTGVLVLNLGADVGVKGEVRPKIFKVLYTGRQVTINLIYN